MTIRFLLVLLIASVSSAACRSDDAAAPPITTGTPTIQQQPTVRPVTAVEIDSARHVLLVSFDGLRPDAIPATDTPVLDRLIQTGSYHPKCLAEFPPVTLPNHTSMVTGLSVLHHAVILNIDLPGHVSSTTIFDVAKAAGLRVGFFVSKGKLTYLCKEETAAAFKFNGKMDPLVDEVVQAIAEKDLQLVFLHFGEPDGTGHKHGWMSEQYLEKVSLGDAALGRVMDAYREKGLLDQLLVIVTSDHGGHDKTHWRDIPEDRNVPFILNGPTIASGRTLQETRRPMDVAATALDYLGLPLDSARDGKPVKEASVDFQPPASNEPAALFGVPCGPFPILMATPMALFYLGTRRGRCR